MDWGFDHPLLLSVSAPPNPFDDMTDGEYKRQFDHNLYKLTRRRAFLRQFPARVKGVHGDFFGGAYRPGAHVILHNPFWLVPDLAQHLLTRLWQEYYPNQNITIVEVHVCEARQYVNIYTGELSHYILLRYIAGSRQPSKPWAASPRYRDRYNSLYKGAHRLTVAGRKNAPLSDSYNVGIDARSPRGPAPPG